MTGSSRNRSQPPCAGSSPALVLPSFGEAIYACRARCNLSQSSVAAAAGISASYYSELENGKRTAPPRSTALKIGRALGMCASDVHRIATLAQAERNEESLDADLPAPVRKLLTTIRLEGPWLKAEVVRQLQLTLEERRM